jgi:hypothetical protein
MVPFWFVVVLASVLPILRLLVVIRGVGKSSACCMVCGYNLTGNTSGVCPECGTAISEKA